MLTQIIKNINESKFLLGIAMLLINVGAKYVDLRLSKTQEQALRNSLARELIIFAIVFMATREIIISLMLTGTFMILADFIFNEDSKFCVIPNHLRKIAMIVDLDGDNRISPMEERDALETLRKAKIQKEKHRQAEFVSYLQN